MATQQPDSSFNWSDFLTCSKCDAVRLVADKPCQCVGAEAIPIWQAAQIPTGFGNAGCLTQFLFFIGIPLLLVFPPFSTFFGVCFILGSVGRTHKFNEEKKGKQEAHLRDYRNRAEELMKTRDAGQKNNATTEFESAKHLFETDQPAMAIDCLKAAIKLGKTDPECKFMLAQCYFSTKEYDSCSSVLEGLMNLSQALPKAARPLLSNVYITRGVSSAAEYEFLVRWSTSFSAPLQRASILAAAHFMEQQQSVPGAAVAVLESARAYEPENPVHSRALVKMACEAGDWKAGCHYGFGIKPDEYDEQSMIAYATCLEKSMDFSERGLEVYRRALQVAPGLEDVRIRLTQLLVRNNQPGAAIATLREGVARDASSIRLRYTLAMTELAVGDTEEALSHLQILGSSNEIGTYRSNSDVYRLMGKCLIKKNLLNAAMNQLQIAGTDKETLEEMYSLGDKFEATGDCSSARKCWEYVYAADVRFKDVATKIAIKHSTAIN